MHTQSLLLLAAGASLASSQPLDKSTTNENAFCVSDFVFGCTVTCDWYFNVTNAGSQANHPAFTSPVQCQGNLDIDSFDDSTCGYISDTQAVAAYINRTDNVLHLRYRVNNIFEGATYWYEGETAVNAMTSGKPQASEFQVPETKAYAIA